VKRKKGSSPGERAFKIDRVEQERGVREW
jgi:hypothetical protein